MSNIYDNYMIIRELLDLLDADTVQEARDRIEQLKKYEAVCKKYVDKFEDFKSKPFIHNPIPKL